MQLLPQIIIFAGEVSAVILNAEKDPEEFHSPPPLGPFNRTCQAFAVAPAVGNRTIFAVAVSAVILNAEKYPEELHSLPPLGPFNRTCQAFAVAPAVGNRTIFAVASFCRHPERSEGSRRTPRHPHRSDLSTEPVRLSPFPY
jgi:hypothetical protein